MISEAVGQGVHESGIPWQWSTRWGDALSFIGGQELSLAPIGIGTIYSACDSSNMQHLCAVGNTENIYASTSCGHQSRFILTLREQYASL